MLVIMCASVCEKCMDDKANAFRSSEASNQCLSAIYQAHGHFTKFWGNSGKSGENSGAESGEKEYT